MKRILVAVDFSDATAGVVEGAAKLAAAFGAELHFFHAIEAEPMYGAYGLVAEDYPGLHSRHDQTQRHALKTLDGIRLKVAGDYGLVSESHLGNGNPLTTIAKKVKEIDVDLVVLGSHGHGVVASLLLGSVAEGLVRKSIVPTLVIPAKK